MCVCSFALFGLTSYECCDVLIFIAGKFLSRAPPRCTFAAGASAPVWMPAHLGRRNDFSRWVLLSHSRGAHSCSSTCERGEINYSADTAAGRHSSIIQCEHSIVIHLRLISRIIGDLIHISQGDCISACLPGSRSAHTYILYKRERESAGCVFALLLICIADCV
jgi:hypothetical protein